MRGASTATAHADDGDGRAVQAKEAFDWAQDDAEETSEQVGLATRGLIMALVSKLLEVSMKTKTHADGRVAALNGACVAAARSGSGPGGRRSDRDGLTGLRNSGDSPGGGDRKDGQAKNGVEEREDEAREHREYALWGFWV